MARSKALHQAIATGGEPDSIAVVTGSMLGDAAGLACPTFVPQFKLIVGGAWTALRDCTPAPAHDAQPNQVKTSLRVTVWRLRLRMISSSWPKQWVMVGRLAWPTTICWG